MTMTIDLLGPSNIVREEFPTRLVMFRRVPNHKLDQHFERLENVTNYNGTIQAQNVGEWYVVTHWATTILEYNTQTRTIERLAHGYISQTTSTLVGRLLRSLPREAVSFCLAQLSTTAPDDAKRLAKMVR